ncbi:MULTISPECIES: PAAR domain-containing protein [Janthinobacterium]|uniref:PAAR domain-containing protein n=1 Tax=Janthinobacterium rivuli TaxID=2751478 RepID=A0ABY8IA68_9BURK|nr:MULTISPECIES: PAAR domain-containing protein [Janthinobacterium]PHV32411.1 PAAR domain-containing protein [Janthinobacterium sp. BJB312]MBW3511533.1 PAAR domain-containing protein [Janthinobacterium sp. NKUCC06_STL]MCA1858709.1 PAAR domain-containing protein [Janthinobacterium lividum]NVI85576.1 PAAR domain-containing protein [Janthinobacterium sp. BJB401]WFR81795.1 PAAR domain-containing protein [Janthinobacterium rivuli]
MAGPVIRLGDKTSHGGTVLEASAVSDSGGIGMARVGDKVACPLPGHGVCPIVSGDSSLIVDGKPVARHGDKTSCGALLIASQQATTDQA